MKRFISILLCAIVLVGSVAGVSYANEDINNEGRTRRENPSNFGRVLRGFVKTFDENEYLVISDIVDAKEDSKEIKQENKDLREQLRTMLKQAKEAGVELEEDTMATLKEARESFKTAKEELIENKAEREADFSYDDIQATIEEAMEDESLFDDITTKLLDALDDINDSLNDRNHVLQQLVDMVENDLN